MSRILKRALALILALLTALLGALPAAAAQEARCDEAYYATLDYYGGLMDSSVVKSYVLAGNSTITDYGSYDEVVNLTDDSLPLLADDKLTFSFGETPPDRFYFEGKTAQPYNDLPWRFSLSYRLNGVPADAETLAGKSGMVEIFLDVTPNRAASEYSRNNLVLTAATAFNADEIESLEAEGAEVQLLGNLRAVLFMVMPGEEQHFVIRVGTEDFSFAGMMFLAVPATLSQLNQIADLREAKEEIEDSYDKLNDSFDRILDSLDGMSDNLNYAAYGLDTLNQARGQVSAGKGEVYDHLDAALDAAGPLTESMEPMSGHLETFQQMLTDTTALLNDMNDNVVSLKPEVEEARKNLNALQKDLESVRDMLNDLQFYPGEFQDISDDLTDDFYALGRSLDNLRTLLNQTQNRLGALQSMVSQLSGGSQITIGGSTVAEIEAALPTARQIYTSYTDSGVSAYGLSLEDFAALCVIYSQSAALQSAYAAAGDFVADYLTGLAAGAPLLDLTDSAYAAAVTQGGKLAALAELDQAEDLDERLELAKQINALLSSTGLSVSQLKSLVNSVVPGGQELTARLRDVCDALDTSGVSGDLMELCDTLEEMLDEVSDHTGTLSHAAGSLEDLLAQAVRVSENADTAIDQLDSLTEIMNTYEPETQQALEDARTFTDAARESISALVDAGRSAENLMRSSGTTLDAGTQQTLSGVSAALRQSTKGLDATDDIRDAKTVITDLIDEKWDKYTGEDSNILLMDAAASPVSLTSAKNATPGSIQYIMRTQEITADDAETESAGAVAPVENVGFFGRVAQMFRDLWNFLTGWLR